MSGAEELIQKLGLQPHPEEGGFFRETYRADESLSADTIDARYGADRTVSTAIYYMLTPTTFSAMHRLKSDEIFHFYSGGPVRMLQLFPDGSGKEIVIGSDVMAGQQPQVLVPRGVWQGSFLEPGSEYALMGCTVAPGFEFADYDHGNREELTAQYPKFKELIGRLM